MRQHDTQLCQSSNPFRENYMVTYYAPLPSHYIYCFSLNNILKRIYKYNKLILFK
uniref:Uncharacterized protein n=1 Tax=Oryza brachyantha TaxID=4533 RepID=J3LCU7_ORYBR